MTANRHCEEDSRRINYLHLAYCSPTSLPVTLLALVPWLLLLFFLLSKTAEEFLVPAVQYLAARLRLPPDIAGAARGAAAAPAAAAPPVPAILRPPLLLLLLLSQGLPFPPRPRACMGPPSLLPPCPTCQRRRTCRDGSVLARPPFPLRART